MYLDEIMGIALSEEFYIASHPYSNSLLSATPISHPLMNKKRIILKRDPSIPIDPPTGCVFHTRCKLH